MLEIRRREFQTETGTALDVTILARILGSAMDEDTVGRLEDAKVKITDYEETKVWIEARQTKLVARSSAKTMPKTDPNAMVYGVDEPRPTPGTSLSMTGAYGGTCAGGCGGCAVHSASSGASPSVPSLDPWLGGDPWSQPAADQWQVVGAPPTYSGGEVAGGLDAFGKGGKGNGGPVECWNCLGKGHPSRLCPSPQGAGIAKGPDRCKVCQGHSHSSAVCTSKGGGKYSAPSPKGKGKGKDGKGKSQWGAGNWNKGWGQGKRRLSLW